MRVDQQTKRPGKQNDWIIQEGRVSCLLEGMKQVIVSYSSYQTVQDGITFLWRLLEKFLGICSLDSGWVEGSPWFVTTLCQSVLFLTTHGIFCTHSLDPLAPSPLIKTFVVILI